MSESRNPSAPATVDIFPSGEIGIVWKDGHESIYSPRFLRCQCRCAACIDEVTGRKILDDAKVAESIRAEAKQSIGHYGIQFVWSDGHASGIYSHTLLRAACPCEACRVGGA